MSQFGESPDLNQRSHTGALRLQQLLQSVAPQQGLASPQSNVGLFSLPTAF